MEQDQEYTYRLNILVLFYARINDYFDAFIVDDIYTNIAIVFVNSKMDNKIEFPTCHMIPVGGAAYAELNSCLQLLGIDSLCEAH